MAMPNYQHSFHYYSERNRIQDIASAQIDQFTYTFENFFHPFIGQLIAQLNKTSVAGLLDPSFLQGLATDSSAQNFFTTNYTLLPSRTGKVNQPYPQKTIDVQPGGSYANYNWELLYHIPVAIAVHLSKNQRFAEAQKWFHLVFDPTSRDATNPPWLRYWKFLGFRQETGSQREIDSHNLDSLLALLSTPDTGLTPDQLGVKHAILAGYNAILKNPFQPHVVARTRTVAYQYYIVMKYLDNLIAWGDSLFLQDTIETINEATLCYVLAANLLGPRPQQLPTPGPVAAKNFAQLKAARLDALGDALVDLESQFPLNFAPPAGHDGGTPDLTGALFGIGRTLYFCIPQNKTLLAYWDTVANRLFKIRHCMNIEGVVRPLALFDPPIDPGMLVRAAGAGIDVGSIVSGLNQPPGPVRSLMLIQKALEICGEVRSLGNALLSALEKGDSEHLALLRQSHEINLQQMTQDVRFLQWQQAREATESLLRSRMTTLERYKYYFRLLGIAIDSTNVPDTFSLDRRELTEQNFDDAYSTLVGEYDKAISVQAYPQLRLAEAGSPATQSGAAGSGRLDLTVNEDAELNIHMPAAQNYRLLASAANTISSILTFIPEFYVNLHFWGLGASSRVAGGSKLSDASKIAAEIFQAISAFEQDQGAMAARTAGYERRNDEWILQANLAARELAQVGRQILSSLIAEQVAYHEYETVKTQIQQAQEVNQFLQTKFTSEELYTWMQGEVSRLYYQYYRFAFDTARKAEQTMKQELMRPEVDATSYVQFNYWDAGRKGLLSGETLYLDVKRMEMAYHENNKREFELTRHISLRQLDPLALLELKVTGACTFSIPEWLYDRDCPGHYMRRIKTVGISIPSVVGPYTSVNCTLTLQRSSVRVSPLLTNGRSYGRDPNNEDDRFKDYLGASQSIVTSGASNDSGMFETNLRDERFLPFEGAGAISTWSLALPSKLQTFDYMTISDVILHVRYTARDGGTQLGTVVTNELLQMFDPHNPSAHSLPLLFNLRYDFPTEWSAFVNGAPVFTATIRRDYFPYFAQWKTITITGLELYDGKDVSKHHAIGSQAVWDAATVDLGNNQAFTVTAGTDPAGPTQVLTRMASAQVFLIVRYTLAA